MLYLNVVVSELKSNFSIENMLIQINKATAFAMDSDNG